MRRARDTSHRRQLTALFVAAGLHLLLLFWVSEREERVPEPTAPLIVELIEVTPPRPAPEPRRPTPDAVVPPALRESSRAPRVEARPPRAPRDPPGRADDAPTSEGVSVTTENAPRPAAPGASGRGVVVPEGVDLFSPDALGEVASRATRGRGEKAEGESADEGTRVGGRLGAEQREWVAQGRAQGPQPSWVGKLADGVRGTWKPEPSQAGLSNGDTAGERVSNLWNGTAPVAGQYGATGSPYAAGSKPLGHDTGRPVEREMWSGTNAFDSHDFMQRWNNGEFAFGELVVVARVLHWNGVGFSIRLIERSGRKAFDEAALEAIRKAALAQLEVEDGTESTWRLSARFVPQTCGSMSGVVSGALFDKACGGVFDPQLGVLERITAGEMKVLTTVELIALLEPGMDVPEIEIRSRP